MTSENRNLILSIRQLREDITRLVQAAMAIVNATNTDEVYRKMEALRQAIAKVQGQ